MNNLTGNLKDSMTATFPREFDIPKRNDDSGNL